MTPQQTIPAAEGAARAGVHVRTLHRWIHQGRITGYRLGARNLRVDPAEIDQLLKPVEVAAR